MADSKLTVFLEAQDRASATIDRVSDKMVHAGRVADQQRSKFDMLGNSVDVAGRKFNILGSGLAVFTRGAAAGGLALGALGGIVVKTGIGFNAMRQQAEIAFTTMLKDGNKAKVFLDDLQKFAAKTPFEFPDLVRNTQRLMAMGFAAQDVIPTLTKIGDAMSGMGKSGAEIDFVVRALGQMQAKGKASAEEMLQLTEQGIPAWRYLAEVLKTDVSGAMKQVERRTVDAGTAIKAITDGMGRDFGGMMEKQSHSFQGLLSTIKDTFSIVAGRVTAPLFERLTGGMQRLVDFTATEDFDRKVNMIADTVGTAIPAAFDRAFSMAKPFYDLVKTGAGFLADHQRELKLMGQGISTLANELPTIIAAFLAWKAAMIGAGMLQRAQEFMALRQAAAPIAVMFPNLAVQMAGAAAASTSLAAGLALLRGAFVALAASPLAWLAALVAVDIAIRKITGSGIIDHLTGAAKAHEAAAKAADKYGLALENIARLQREGATNARQLEIDRLAEAAAAVERRRAELAQWVERAGGTTAGPLGREITETKAAIKHLQEQFKDLELTNAEWQAIFRKSPELLNLFSEESEKTAEAARRVAQESERMFGDAWFQAQLRADKKLGQTRDVFADLKTKIDLAREANDLYADAVDRAAGAVKGQFDPVGEMMKLQVMELERMKLAMGDAFGAENQQRLDNLRRTLEAHNTDVEIAAQRIRVLGAVWFETMNGNAAEVRNAKIEFERLTNIIESMPASKRVEIAAKLPYEDMNKMLAFMSLLARGVEVPVALAYAERIGEMRNAAAQLKGPISGLIQRQIDKTTGTVGVPSNVLPQSYQNYMDEFNREVNNTGSVAGSSAKSVKSYNNALISMQEAQERGLSEEQVARLELADAVKKQAEEEYRARVEFIKLGIEMNGMTLEAFRTAQAFKQLQDYMRETGKTANEVMRDAAEAMKNAFQSAYDSLFNRPTKETLGMQLQLAELEKKRLLMLQGGGSEEEKKKRLQPLDAEIDALRNAIALREKEFEILRIKNQLADASLLTDGQLISQAAYLTEVIRGVSQNFVDFKYVADLETLARINYANAVNEAAASIRGTVSTISPRPMAMGGIVNRPTIALLGEGGFPEEVRRYNGRSGEGVHNEYHFTITGSRQDAEEIARAIQAQLNQNQQMQALAGSTVGSQTWGPVDF